MVKKKYIIIIFHLFLITNLYSQEKNNCSTLEISEYYHGVRNYFSIHCDTLDYIEMLIGVYEKRYENCEFFSSKRDIEYTEFENTPRSAGAIINSPHRTSFVVLYIIEYEILKSGTYTDSSFPFIRNNYKGYDVKAEFTDKESLENVNPLTNEIYRISYKRDNRDLKKIYSLYKKWIKKVRKIGLKEIRRKGIKPLDGSVYEWNSAMIRDS